jgi:hypothetical protein
MIHDPGPNHIQVDIHEATAQMFAGFNGSVGYCARCSPECDADWLSPSSPPIAKPRKFKWEKL